MELPVFKEWPKIHRLNRDIIVTEKIDGTNGVIHIAYENNDDPLNDNKPHTSLIVTAGSRNRWLTPSNDNFGFAKWAADHSMDLLTLGPGYHYGEFWGHGIQRGYGLPKDDKRFSLFNWVRWHDDEVRPKCCSVVPQLYYGPFDEKEIKATLAVLKERGSFAAPFMNPEGIVIFHTHSNTGFKVTLEGDEKPKGKENVI